MRQIFQPNPSPTPSQLLTIADRRYRDAVALVATGNNERAVGAAYLAGYVVEILLKRQLLLKYHSLASRKDRSSLPGNVVRLFWFSHNLEAMLDELTDVRETLRIASLRSRVNYLSDLEQMLSWSPFARYSPHSATMADARQLLERVNELRKVLR